MKYLLIAYFILLIIMSVYDLITRSIPVIGVIVMGIVAISIFVLKVNEQETTIIKGLISTIPGLLLCFLSFFFPEDIGIGDGLVIITVGLEKGFYVCCLVLMVSQVCIVFISIIFLGILRHKGITKNKMPMIPFIAFGTLIVEFMI